MGTGIDPVLRACNNWLKALKSTPEAKASERLCGVLFQSLTEFAYNEGPDDRVEKLFRICFLMQVTAIMANYEHVTIVANDIAKTHLIIMENLACAAFADMTAALSFSNESSNSYRTDPDLDVE